MKGTPDFYTKALIDATHQCIHQARIVFPQHPITLVEISCDLKGTQAGQYHSAKRLIRYNLPIAMEQWDEFVERTVIHEVAHHVVAEIWGTASLPKSASIKPHGQQWREVMHALGAKDVRRCHNYQLDGIKIKRQRRFIYTCACQEHHVSATRHHRVLSGAVYCCKRCQQKLIQQL